MGILSNLFGKKASVYSQPKLDPEGFRNEADIKEKIKKFRRSALVLHPERSLQPLGQNVSKFGGLANMNGFEEWPHCHLCSKPMNFVLQIYRKDFPDVWFPQGSHLMQIWRCPDIYCPADDAGEEMFYDIPTELYFFNEEGTDWEADTRIEKPEVINDSPEELQVVNECRLVPALEDDFPRWENEEKLSFNYSEEALETLAETLPVRKATKFNGWPAWTQPAGYPECDGCGQEKEFFFQLSSEDGADEEAEDLDWSPHGVMIGDVGNIYWFYCPRCGDDTIEVRWDGC